MASLRNLNLPLLTLLLCFCFAAGFLGASRVSAQEGSCWPPGSIGNCRSLIVDAQWCARGCCMNPPSGETGCCTNTLYYCNDPLPASRYYTKDCNNPACAPNALAGP